MRQLITLLVTLGCAVLAESALSACTWTYERAPQSTYQINAPSSLTVSRVPIGGILASFSQRVGLQEGIQCPRGNILNTTIDIGFPPSAIPNVYQTSVPGIGIRVIASRINAGGKGAVYNFPGQLVIDGASVRSPYLPTYIYVEFVRTEVAVGSGEIPVNFTAEFASPSDSGLTPSTVTYVSTGTTNLDNNFFFSSCESQEPTKTVPMGKIAISNIQSGAALEQRYTFEVRCRGMRPTKPAPMKVYFEGNSTAAGMLNLTGAGQPGVAKGVVIEVKDDKGSKLPFNKPGAISLDWQRSEVDAEIYRFSGVARYTASGGEIKAGKADATMTYVLDYN
ncbi:fimbrial protein [Pseudomonas sp. NPDC089530]|uniref:fimbrial protein n=1 Tax=Pseudomonas sp. NPDC089530 TaxID=3390651 RepID=UPI003CFC1697